MSVEEQTIVLGKITGAHGIKGWVKIHSFTETDTDILNYQPLTMVRRGQPDKQITLLECKLHGKGLVARIEGIDDRNQAELLANSELVVPRQQLPGLAQGEYYWADLVGLMVRTEQGEDLGTIVSMMETGANDVVVVKGDEREYLIPFIQPDVVKEVNLDEKYMRVDWDPDF